MPALVAAHRLVTHRRGRRVRQDPARARRGAGGGGRVPRRRVGRRPHRGGRGEQVVTTVTSALGLALPADRLGARRAALVQPRPPDAAAARQLRARARRGRRARRRPARRRLGARRAGHEPGAAGRRRRARLAARPAALPAAGRRPPHGPAVELFLERLAARPRDRRLDDAALERVARICRAVDGVPLAIELAAARARAYSLDEIAAQVTRRRQHARRASAAAPAGHHRTVRFAVEQSYRTLSRRGGALHRAVSVVPGPFTAASAAALVDRPVAEVRTRCSPASCTARCWCRSARSAPGRPSRFAQLATVRGHAAHSGDATETAELVAARDRLGRRARRPPRPGSATPASPTGSPHSTTTWPRCAPRCSTASPTPLPRSACGSRRGWGCTGTTAG